MATTTLSPGGSYLGPLVDLWSNPRAALSAVFEILAPSRERKMRACEQTQVLVVDNDHWYRDKILIPCLKVLGPSEFFRAHDMRTAMRQLNRHPGIGIVICDAVLARGEDGISVCRLAKQRKLQVVLLSSVSEIHMEAYLLTDAVIIKHEASLLDTVRQIQWVGRRLKWNPRPEVATRLQQS